MEIPALSSSSFSTMINLPESTPVLSPKQVKRCHIVLPDDPKPTGAIIYGNRYYAYVRAFPSQDAAERGAQRLLAKGNQVVLTTTHKGLVLWVLEPEAQPVRPSVH
jgi:hypothetical protein